MRSRAVMRTSAGRQPVRPYIRAIGHYTSGSYEGMSVGNALFTFNDIGGIALLEWLTRG